MEGGMDGLMDKFQDDYKDGWMKELDDNIDEWMDG